MNACRHYTRAAAVALVVAAVAALQVTPSPDSWYLAVAATVAGIVLLIKAAAVEVE